MRMNQFTLLSQSMKCLNHTCSRQNMYSSNCFLLFQIAKTRELTFCEEQLFRNLTQADVQSWKSEFVNKFTFLIILNIIPLPPYTMLVVAENLNQANHT